MTKYFGHRPDTGEILTQSFDKVVFQFSYEDNNLEIQTMQAYTIVARAFAQEREIKPSQHKDLVKLIEKRFPPNSQITMDYLHMKLQDNVTEAETWKSCMIRFIKVLNIARRAQAKVVKYGSPSVGIRCKVERQNGETELIISYGY